MQRHYCNVEKAWMDFEDECSWCGQTEEEVRQYAGLQGDALLEEIKRRVNRTNDGHITDD